MIGVKTSNIEYLDANDVITDRTKDCNIKKETNLGAYISVNFLHFLTNSAPQIMQIFPAFQRDTF